MLRFQVKVRGRWVEVDKGIVLANGCLAWWRNQDKGIISPPYWMLTESTRRDPRFRQVCWDALTEEERQYSLTRRGLAA